MPTSLINPNRPEVQYPDYLTSGSITSQALAPTPTLDFKTPQPTPAYPVATMPPAPVAMTQPETQASSVNKRLQGLQERLVGQSAYRGQQEQGLGIPGLETTVSDLTSQLEGLKAEAAAIPLQLEQRNTGYASVGATQRQSQAALRENAIKALSVSSLLNAANRRLTTAQTQADRAVAQRFDPIKEEIAAVTANLDLILKSPEYSVAEKNRAEQQKAVQEAKAQTIKKAEESNKTALAMSAAAITNNPGNQAAALAAQQVQNLDPTAPDYMAKVFELVGPYQTDPLDTQLKQSQIRAQNALAQQRTNVGGGGSAPAGYNGEFAATVDLISNKGGTNQQRTQIRQNLQRAIAQGDYPTAYQYVIDATGRALTAENRTKLENAAIDNSLLQGLRSRLQALRDAGYDTSLLTGSADNIQKKLGVLQTDPRYAALAGELDRFFQQYRQNMTGAAFGAQESSEYAKVLPSKSNTFDLNVALINGALTFNNGYVEGAIRSSIGEGGVHIKEYAEGATPQQNVAPASSNVSEQAQAVGLDLQAALDNGYSIEEIQEYLENLPQ